MPDYDDEDDESLDLDALPDRSSRSSSRSPAVLSNDIDDLDEDPVPVRSVINGSAPASSREPDDLDDDDDDDEDDQEDDEDEDDEPEDAGEDEIDFVIAAYRDDGTPQIQALPAELANDLEELIANLRRLPGEAGAIGFVSLLEEVFVIVRVRGRHVQVLLNDGSAAVDFPIARDVADLLGEEVSESEEEAEPMGDLGIFADLGVSDFEMETLVDDLDRGSDQILIELADKIKLGPQFRRVAESAFGS